MNTIGQPFTVKTLGAESIQSRMEPVMKAAELDQKDGDANPAKDQVQFQHEGLTTQFIKKGETALIRTLGRDGQTRGIEKIGQEIELASKTFDYGYIAQTATEESAGGYFVAPNFAINENPDPLKTFNALNELFESEWIAIPEPRRGDVMAEPIVRPNVLAGVQERVDGKLFSTLDNPEVKAMQSEFQAQGEISRESLPEGWKKVGRFDSLGQMDGEQSQSYANKSSHPDQCYQVLTFDKESGKTELITHHAYTQETDFEGSLDEQKITAYPDGEYREQYRSFSD